MSFWFSSVSFRAGDHLEAFSSSFSAMRSMSSCWRRRLADDRDAVELADGVGDLLRLSGVSNSTDCRPAGAVGVAELGDADDRVLPGRALR